MKHLPAPPPPSQQVKVRGKHQRVPLLTGPQREREVQLQCEFLVDVFSGGSKRASVLPLKNLSGFDLSALWSGPCWRYFTSRQMSSSPAASWSATRCFGRHPSTNVGKGACGGRMPTSSRQSGSALWLSVGQQGVQKKPPTLIDLDGFESPFPTC